jgi:DNA-binding response OmpR family regulator
MSETEIRKIVLIVDDVEDNRVLLERALRSGGYMTVSVDSGMAALAWMSNATPDIVLLDWMMPGLSGLETLRTIRASHSAASLPVIMCTAMGEEENVVEAIEAGANDYVTKPISIPILRARMNAHLSQSATVSSLNSEKVEAKRQLTEQTRRLFAQRQAG